MESRQGVTVVIESQCHLTAMWQLLAAVIVIKIILATVDSVNRWHGASRSSARL